MLAVLLWIFSVYGFISAVWHILRLLTYRRPVFPPTDVTLVVRNAEPFIEGLLRRIAAEVAVAVPGLRVVVVDDGSADNTMAIVERLAERETWLEACPVAAGRAPGVGAVLPGVTGGSAGWGATVGLPLPLRAGGEALPAPRRWVGFDLRSGGGLETVMPTLRALYGLGPETGARRAEAAGTGERGWRIL
ncbi:glycosyltransferase [Kyrpidia tusciae]|uniref:Glycosyl transferase family 2 n=1 Tax=Kyrpidia tusciae (strain DSM 2912 / NBRC 15312 / T2) TaxID=562970 RepID=D5WVT6_KYRT2|nr:glycosyltransferase [Kyrpidia tusciae]ADG07629.1 glycosyl transferase family 2 [Kyrpidia tusciae DSM 2912]